MNKEQIEKLKKENLELQGSINSRKQQNEALLNSAGDFAKRISKIEKDTKEKEEQLSALLKNIEESEEVLEATIETAKEVEQELVDKRAEVNELMVKESSLIGSIQRLEVANKKLSDTNTKEIGSLNETKELLTIKAQGLEEKERELELQEKYLAKKYNLENLEKYVNSPR